MKAISKVLVTGGLGFIEKSGADYLPVNVGSGRAISIRQVAKLLADLLNLKIEPIISNKFRKGRR